MIAQVHNSGTYQQFEIINRRYMHAYIICWITISNLFYGESAIPIIRKLFHPEIKILEELNSYELIIFSTNISVLNHDLYRNILLQVPAISVDLTRMTSNVEKTISTLTRNPTSTTVYIIFETRDGNETDSENIKCTLDIITQWSMISSRPKLLIVYQTVQKFSYEHLKTILTHAWSLEFVDCTILVTTPRNVSSIFMYNPFTKQMVEDRAIIELFPNKLCNLHGYSIKLPSIELPPYINVIRNSKGIPVDMVGMSYQYCRILSETLNFSLKIVSGLENSVILGNFTVLFEKLHSKEIDMLTMPFNVRSIMYHFKDMLLIGKLFLNTNYVILVPIEPSIQIDIPLDVIVFVPLTLFIISAFQGLKKLFRFPSKHWCANKVFQILLGITVSRNSPKTILEKIMFMSLVLVSMKYSVDTLTKIMDIKIVKGEVDYNYLSDIAESDLPIYTVNFIIGHVYANTDDKVLLKIKSKTSDTLDIFQCLNEMVMKRSCMCITPHSAGAYLSKQYVKADGTPTIKVARPILYDDMAAFGYATASPFATKFDSMIQRIVESGISDTWSGSQNYTIKSEDFSSRKPIRENIFLQQLCALLVVGYFIACITFLVEVIRAKSKRRVDKTCDKKFGENKKWRKLHRRLL